MASSREKREAPRHHVRRMTSADVPHVLAIFRENNLSETRHGVETFMRLDPDGFQVAVDDETGAILGMCSGNCVAPDVAFVGFYAVKPEYHGMGIGIGIWKQVMAHIGDRNMGLSAVPAQVSTYRDKAGFRLEDIHRMVCYEGDEVDSSFLIQHLQGITVIPVDEKMMASTVDYDASILGYSREALLRLSFAEKDILALSAVDVKKNEVVGYGVFRTNNFGRAMASPVYTNSLAVAELLLYHLIQGFPLARKGLVMMVLSSNELSRKLCERLGLKVEAEAPRLFTRHIPHIPDVNRIFSLFSPDFSPF